MKTDQDLGDLEYLLYFPNTAFFIGIFFVKIFR